LVGSFVAHPTDEVEKFTGFPIPVVVFRVRYLVEFIFHITVNLNGFWWWRSSVLESVWDMGFKLRYMENGMDPAEVVGEQNSNGVPADAVEDLEGTEVAFGERTRGTGSADEFGEDEYFVAGVERRRRSPVGVRGCLVALLSELEGFCKIEVKFLKVGSKFPGLERCDVVLRMDVQGRVVALVCEEW